jgi:pimeloyl-ACP methyl ester carboxylesterase
MEPFEATGVLSRGQKAPCNCLSRTRPEIILERMVRQNRLPASVTAAAHRARRSRLGVILGIAAAALAATAVFNVYEARRVARRNPPQGRFIDVDGVRLHYLEKGEGPPVVLLHGNVVTAEDFAYSGLLDLTAERHRVIAFDRPGMGYSDRPNGRLWTPGVQADLLRRAFDRLGIERAVVLGHSLGAMVAAAFALDHPDAVRGLVLLSGYFYPTARADVALASPPAIPVLGDVLRYTVSPIFGRALLPAVIKGMFTPREVPADFAEHFPPGMSVRPSQIRASAQDAAAMIPAAAAMRHRYRELSMPLVIMAGRDDKVADVGRQSVRLHEEIPHSSIRLVPNVGHMVHYAVPEEVVAAIETVSGRAGGASYRHDRNEEATSLS